MAKNFAITIGRQFGSGGREIGERLGELLGIKSYDKELLKMAADKKGIHPDYLRRVDEKANSSLLYTLAMGVSMHRAGHTGAEMPINDKLFMAQTEVIKEIGICYFCGTLCGLYFAPSPGTHQLFHLLRLRSACGARDEGERLSP